MDKNEQPWVIDDLTAESPRASNGARWQLVTDGVMGGVSDGVMERTMVAGRVAIRMRGDVRLENNGGFVQIALDLAEGGGIVDASAFAGIEIDVFGNDEDYGVHLRTEAVRRPWESYRQTFRATRAWQALRLPFTGFAPHRLDAPLDVSRLRRIGVVAIGRRFTVDLALARVAFFRGDA
jgi:hypothetical protein